MDEPGNAATTDEARTIKNDIAAANTLNRAAAGGKTNPQAMPTMPKATSHPAKRNTTRLASNPPGVKHPKTEATIGVPAVQAARDTPHSPPYPSRHQDGRLHAPHRSHTTIPNITANESMQPVSNKRSGALPYAKSAVSDHAASESPLRPNVGATR